MRGREVFTSDLDGTNFILFTAKNKQTHNFAFSIMLEFERVAGISNFFSAKITDFKIFRTFQLWRE